MPQHNPGNLRCFCRVDRVANSRREHVERQFLRAAAEFSYFPQKARRICDCRAVTFEKPRGFRFYMIQTILVLFRESIRLAFANSRR